MNYKKFFRLVFLGVVLALSTNALATSNTTQLQYNDNTGPYFQYPGNPFGNGKGK